MPRRIGYFRNTGDYARDTAHLTLEEHGAYNLLIDYYSNTGRPIPVADLSTVLRKIWGVSAQKTRKLREKIGVFFYVFDGCWHHKRIDAEIEKEFRKQGQREHAARSRWANENKDQSLKGMRSHMQNASVYLNHKPIKNKRSELFDLAIDLFNRRSGLSAWHSRQMLQGQQKMYGAAELDAVLADLVTGIDQIDPAAWVRNELRQRGEKNGRNKKSSAGGGEADRVERLAGSDPGGRKLF